MAEILLSLTVIGVVAAITLPSLTANINERTWNAQRKALYSRVSQAITLMPSLNGYGTFTSATDNNNAEIFITKGLAKVLEINNICDNEHLTDCGITTSFKTMSATQSSIPKTLFELNSYFSKTMTTHNNSANYYSCNNTKAAAFETINGESVIIYYNPSCRAFYIDAFSDKDYSNKHVTANTCVNFIYDLNGRKGPNTVGKDIGIMTVFNATDPIVVAPLPSSANNAKNNTKINSWETVKKTCNLEDSTSRLPNIDELSAMLINMNIINLAKNNYYWSSSVASSNYVWDVNTINGHGGRGMIYIKATSGGHIRCVKR